MPSLTTIIASTHELPKGTKIFSPPDGGKVKVVSYTDVLELGKAGKHDPTPPKVSFVAILMCVVRICSGLLLALSHTVDNSVAFGCGSDHVHQRLHRKAQGRGDEAF